MGGNNVIQGSAMAVCRAESTSSFYNSSFLKQEHLQQLQPCRQVDLAVGFSFVGGWFGCIICVAGTLLILVPY
jgi:hypothetical protein